MKVLLDRDLADLYEVETSQLKRAVRRNIERFPPDFMFELNNEELENLRCQIGISSWGGTRYAPMAFTEQGVAMLSSVLKSERAIKVNIAIMRAPEDRVLIFSIRSSVIGNFIEGEFGRFEAGAGINGRPLKPSIEPLSRMFRVILV